MSDVFHLLHRGARAASGDAIAVRLGTETITFDGLESLAYAFCTALSSAGVGPGDRVAVLAKNSIEYVALYLAAARSGAVLVPLNWRLTATELDWILDDAAPRLLLVDAAHQSSVASRSHTLFGDGRWPTNGSASGSAKGNPASEHPLPMRATSEPAVQMYTSGTSGRPKGAVLTHGNCVAMTEPWARSTGLAAGDVFLQVTPLFHVGGMLLVLSCLATGATLTLLPEFDPAAAADALATHRITHTLMVPAMVEWLLRELRTHDTPQAFPDLRLVIYGAAPMSFATLDAARTALDCDFLQGYGLTETTGVLLVLTQEDHREAWTRGDRQRLLSAGRAIEGSEVRLVDDADRPVATGDVGEIVARGANVSTAYWRPAPDAPPMWRDGWFPTGDMGRADADGYITIVDRKKDMILVGGENVYPREVEAVLNRQDAVHESAVIGVPHSVWGEAVLAYVVLAEGAALDARSLQRSALQELARFKCPSRIEVLLELPRNAAGKIEKRTLRAPHWQGQERNV